MRLALSFLLASTIWSHADSVCVRSPIWTYNNGKVVVTKSGPVTVNCLHNGYAPLVTHGKLNPPISRNYNWNF